MPCYSSARAISLALLALFISGCASPRYQNVKRYETGAATQACLATCVTAEQACKHDCQSRHEACVKSIEPDAQARYQAALRQYEQSLIEYRWDLERYRHELAWGYWGGGWGYYSWFPPFPPSPPPAMPTLEREKQRLAHERCDQDCGCQSGYDACYVRCGGQIIHETQCIANCPPDRK